jgi:anti-anti-sigma regulatory factor
MTSFTSRYGNPAADFQGASIRARHRHGATVVAVSGRVDARNLTRVTDQITRFVLADTPFVLDLGAVTSFTSRAAGLLDAVEARCAAAGVSWALIPGDAVASRVRDLADLPVAATVAEAEHQFDEALQKRRSLLLPLLLRKTA